jgi:hypothetical protein
MIEVFITNVESKEAATIILDYLFVKFPSCKINFDIEDCDHILRVEGSDFSVKKIIESLKKFGYKCSLLE